MSDFQVFHDLSARIENATERRFLARAYEDHLRNGRGFWPVVTIDGIPQVVQFSSPPAPSIASTCHRSTTHNTMPPALDRRWTPETGEINIIPLYALPITDWPRVNLTLH